jgi:hypothetical protein
MNSHSSINNILSPHPATAIESEPETHIINSLQPQAEETNLQEIRIDITDEPIVHKEVSLLWYPKTKAYGFTHVKLAVDDEVWSCDGGYQIFATLAKSEEKAKTSGKGRGFFRYNLAVSPSEAMALKEYLYSKQNKGAPYQTCIGGASNALSKNTSVRIMKFFPTIVAASLSLGRKTGLWAKKVKQVEYIGNGSALNNLASLKVGVDIASSIAVCGVIGETLYYSVSGIISASR